MLFVIMVLGQIADYVTTLRALKIGMVEKNPAIVAVFGKRPSWDELLSVKIILLIILCVLNTGVGPIVYLFGAIAGLGAAWWNVYQIRSRKNG